VFRSLGTSHQPQLDGDSNQKCSEHTGGQNLDRGLPDSSTRLTPGIDETPQVTDIAGSVPVLKAKAGQSALSSSLGGAGEQLIKIFRAQVQDVSGVNLAGLK